MKIKLLFLFIYLVGLYYFLQPEPKTPLLQEAGISDEPGDTWQHPNQKGFYTNLTRAQVLEEIQNKFTLSIFGYPLPSYRLNFRPEEAGSLVRDQIKSNYLEEIIYPLHSSLFVNGWEPKKAPQSNTAPSKIATDLYLHGVPYEAKVTLSATSSSSASRVLVWTLLFPACFLVFKSLQLSLHHE